MITNSNTRYGIRQQVLLITLLPLVVMTLIMAGYFVSTRISDNQTALIERGETMSRLLAEASEFGLISGLTHQLSALSQGPIQEHDVADVIFFDAHKNTLYRARDFDLNISLSNQAINQRNGEYWLFSTPVKSSGVLVGDSPEFNNDEETTELLGWIVVAISTQPMHARENQIISNSLLLLLSGFLITFIIAARFAETLTKPILSLTSVIRELQEGKLSARVEVRSTAELGSLEQGVNLLAEQVQLSNQRLESQVDKATQRLRKTMHHLETQNIALQRARQRADQANLAKDEFLARMSHELRTPLTSVLGFTSMLRQTDLTYEQQEHCRIINQTSTMLLAIIDDILDFAKLQSDAIRLERIEFNPERVIYEAIEMQSQSAAIKGLELAFRVESSASSTVLGDPTRLRQIATNLISNAIKFTDNGQIIISLDTLKKENGTQVLELSVKDSGIGITEEQKKHLFNAFSQADSSITRRFGGTGLGLVIVRKLVQLMQGEINLESTPAKGTTVRCSFAVKTINPIGKLQKKPSPSGKLIIFDRHPETLASLVELTAPNVSKIEQCATMQSLESTLSRTDDRDTSLIFGVSANPDLATQQKLKLNSIFNSFKGRILLITPAIAGHFTELSELNNRLELSVATKPLQRDLVQKWLSHASLEQNSIKPPESSNKLSPGHKVLIAEDNDFNRLLLRKIVEAAGAEVFEARNGQQAIEQTRKLKPSAVIMDVHMPVLDGISATRTIRNDMPDLPIIALTANVISSEEHELRQAGISRIEYKPVKDEKLIHLLCLLCDNSSGSDISSNKAVPEVQENSISGPHAKSPLLDKYELSQDSLHQELIDQLDKLKSAFKDQDDCKIRDHCHQLTGLAGLLELPELESCSIELNEAIKKEDRRETWQQLWRLQRLIEHQQY